MTDYLNVYNLNRQKSAVLQNAFEITETQELNKIYTLDFKIPADDVKVQFLQPFHYVRYGDTGQLYRIIKSELEDSATPMLSVNCEHVIATLVDDLMFGAYQYGGGTVKTADVIRWLLSKQKTANWELAECDFVHRYEYNWEQENILNALYSIPKEFTKAYKWTFNTSGYPWKLSLKAIDATIHPEYYIRAKRNLLSSGTAQDFAGICTRIYPLGYGEGVNQLTIKDATVKNIKKSGNINVNADVDESGSTKYGNTYIQSDAAIVAQYGIKEKVLVDRRFEDANSLFSYGKTMLEGLQTPSMSRSFNVVDLYPLTSQNIDSAEVGKICKMTGDDTIAYITKTKRILDEPGNLEIDLSTKATDIASSIADLADRVRIESVYAQGATQLYQHSKDANATPTKGMVMSLYFPSEMRQINKVLLRLKLGKFRSYSQTSDYGGSVNQDTGEAGSINIDTETGGAINKSTEDGGAINKNTEDGGAINKNTEDGGAINKNTEDGGAIDKNTEDGGAIDKNTEDGGAINTSTGSGGGGSGQTGVADGGGNLSLSATANVTINNTSDAQWSSESTIPTSETNVNDYEHYGTQMTTVEAGSHDHTLSGHVNTVTPLASRDYEHTHYLNGTGDANASVDSNGSHLHTVNDVTGHSHGISKDDLKHFHTGSGSVTVTINNSNGSGSTQTNFSHSHSFYVDDHTHPIKVDSHTHPIKVDSHTHPIKVDSHTHPIKVDGHTHPIKVDGHTHPIKVDGHTHPIKVDAHTHKIIILAHRHGITAGIFESGNPTGFTIKVSGTAKATINATSYDNDIVTWLLDSKNQVPRDTWIDVEIIPNDLAYCQCSVFVQGFVQSRGGGNF